MHSKERLLLYFFFFSMNLPMGFYYFSEMQLVSKSSLRHQAASLDPRMHMNTQSMYMGGLTYPYSHTPSHRWPYSKRSPGLNSHYACSFCDKTYLTLQSLKRHMMIHEGRLFQCPVCDAKFTQKVSVKAHLRNVHKSAQCTTCQRVFLIGDDFNKHVLQCS